MIDISTLLGINDKPAPFAQAGGRIWTDPHVSQQLLLAHLDPNTDAASRRPESIDRTVAWVVDTLDLRPGSRILDLGCGPGLYSQRFARLGMQVTGLDVCEASIAYAQKQACAENLQIDYRLQNYLEYNEKDRHDLALLIYGDYCALSPSERRQLLAVVRRALRKNGKLIMDVTTRVCRMKHRTENHWYVADRGFWSDKPHLVLEQGYDYPAELIYLDQFVVIDENGDIRIFRNWFQDYSVASIEKELEAGGFRVLGTYGDLFGNPYVDGSDWIGLVAEA